MKNIFVAKTCVQALVVFIIGMVIMRVSIDELEKISHGFGVLDLTVGWDYQEVVTHIISMGEKGRQYYLNTFQKIDIFYPIFYGSFYFFTLGYLTKILYNNVFLLLLFPVIGVLLDWSENFIIRSMLLAPNTINSRQMVLFTIFQTGKFFFVYLSLALILMLGIVCIRKSRQSS